MNIQYLKDDKGNTQYVVAPYHVGFNMMLDRVPVEEEGEEDNWEENPLNMMSMTMWVSPTKLPAS